MKPTLNEQIARGFAGAGALPPPTDTEKAVGVATLAGGGLFVVGVLVGFAILAFGPGSKTIRM